MLNNFTWNMTGYIPKHQVNPHGDGTIPYVAEHIFQLEPEPPAVDSLNEYILSALQEKHLIYFSFFLHHYEPQLNKRIKSFLGVDGGDLVCVREVQKLRQRARFGQSTRLKLRAHRAVEHEEPLAAQGAPQALVLDGDVGKRVAKRRLNHGRSVLSL